ncbi:hypothetical protein EYD10_16472 [Varanus komodoensis]|nr:hypothetical protein EYD10_16472 [Varanus komodoensis]
MRLLPWHCSSSSLNSGTTVCIGGFSPSAVSRNVGTWGSWICGPNETEGEWVERDTCPPLGSSVWLGVGQSCQSGRHPCSSDRFPDRCPPALAAHCSASICLSFFVFERWEIVTYWYIMGFCSALPAAVEALLFISVFGLKKKPL